MVSTSCCSRPAPASSTANASGRTSRTRRTTRRRGSFGLAPVTARSRRGRATSRRTASSGRRRASVVRHCTTSRTRRARCRGRFPTTAGPTPMHYDRDHAAPFGYRELIPYYEWVEHTLPVQTAAMGTKEERFLRGAAKLGLPHQTSKDITVAAYRPQENAILQPAGHGRADERSEEARLSAAREAARFAGTARRAASSR